MASFLSRTYWAMTYLATLMLSGEKGTDPQARVAETSVSLNYNLT